MFSVQRASIKRQEAGGKGQMPRSKVRLIIFNILLFIFPGGKDQMPRARRGKERNKAR